MGGGVSEVTMRYTLAIFGIATLLVGCGGEYRDDPKNFGRALRFSKPADVEHVHSHYWQSAHFTDEHCYYLELMPKHGSNLLWTLVESYQRNYQPDSALATNIVSDIPPKLVLERPVWFAPKPPVEYYTLVSTNAVVSFGILLDRKDGRIFVYGQCL